MWNNTGITGTNGKTTTTAMTGHILKASGIPVQVGGNIGTPPASMVRTSRAGQWNVLELSSFQLETIHQFKTHIAAILNVTPDHLDRHGTMDRYAEAKARLFMEQRASDYAVLNADDPRVARFAAVARGRVVTFGRGEGGTPVWSLPQEGCGRPVGRLGLEPRRRVLPTRGLSGGATPTRRVRQAARSAGRQCPLESRAKNR